MSNLFNVSVDFLISVIIIFLEVLFGLFSYLAVFHIFFPQGFISYFYVFHSFKHVYFVFSFSDFNFVIPSSWNSFFFFNLFFGCSGSSLLCAGFL